MRPTGLMWITLAASFVISGCSKMEGTRPASSEQPAARPAAIGTGGAGATLDNDGDFVRDVATKNMAALEFSRIALNKATSPDIKSFAQMMVEDDSAARDKLNNVVAGQPVQGTAQFDDNQKENADELTKKQGVDFDREYIEAMVEVYQDLTAKLESRLDVQSLADWKTAAAGRTYNKALPEPQIATRDVPVRPNKSENELTTKINQWAADTYPVAQKHLDTARTLENAVKKRSTN